jgi:hypothetical protein
MAKVYFRDKRLVMVIRCGDWASSAEWRAWPSLVEVPDLEASGGRAPLALLVDSGAAVAVKREDALTLTAPRSRAARAPALRVRAAPGGAAQRRLPQTEHPSVSVPMKFESPLGSGL